MKKIIKNIALIFLVLFLLIQFYPRASKNNNTGTTNDITQVHSVPNDVQDIIKNSCYNCHSNNTVYPWYSYIQPVSWWLNDHIVEGKKELNFSDFANYNLARQYRKLEEINKEVNEGEMPLQSYTVIHGNAKLSTEQKLSLATWTDLLRDSMQKNYPADSLIRKKK